VLADQRQQQIERAVKVAEAERESARVLGQRLRANGRSHVQSILGLPNDNSRPLQMLVRKP
jgi:hypothetical protein